MAKFHRHKNVTPKCRKKYAERLRMILAKYEIKEVELAEMLDVDPSTVGGWVKGEHLPTVERQQLIEDLFSGENISVETAKEDVEKEEEKMILNAENNTSIKRNGSGYMDPTAYQAIRNVVTEGNVKRGEIYQYFSRGSNHVHKVLVIGVDNTDDNKIVSVLFLYSGNRSKMAVELSTMETTYVDCTRMISVKKDTLTKRIGAVSGAELKAIKDMLRSVLDIRNNKSASDVVESQDVGHLKEMLSKATKKVDYMEKELEEAKQKNELLNKKLLEQTTQLADIQYGSNEMLILKTQLEVYKQQNELLLERLVS